MEDHSMHSGHGGHDGHMAQCTMMSSLNWQTKNVCILLSSWQINSALSLVLSCIAIFLLSVLYEKFRVLLDKWSSTVGAQIHYVSAHCNDEEEPQVYIPSSKQNRRTVKFFSALANGMLLLYSFSLMLIIMTYNGFLIISVISGAMVGHYYFAEIKSLPENTLACH
ncbi:hypothetical protein BB561_004151 [Smittium simulii]|uniref:Copper transport protein n=1 Tax=Smittium simulii TaxID=133385 RepID=A0A2T9YHP5_9FUNG|nr:hypothetical protein BB561_004151 [Smittium simulii]